MGDYRVNLDIFAGPLDLLLYLVRKEEVDIYDIELARIMEQYLNYVEMLKHLDMDLAGDFLVMAATLMQIKSAMLLPRADPEQMGDDDLNDPRTELIRQLLEYKKFKDAANLLNESAAEQRERFVRPATIVEKLKGDTEPELDLEQVSVWDLLEAFDKIVQSTGNYFDISHIEDDTPIDLYQVEILHRLQNQGPTVFERIFGDRPNHLVIIGLFLAMLELIREKLVWVEQAEGDGSLYLRALTDEPAEQAVQKAIQANDDEAAVKADTETAEQEDGAAEQVIGEASEEAETEQQQTPIPIVELAPEKGPAGAVESQRQENIDLL